MKYMISFSVISVDFIKLPPSFLDRSKIISEVISNARIETEFKPLAKDQRNEGILIATAVEDRANSEIVPRK
jgi:hypothetical protein